jgi:sulfoxide reductase catalytic subunit YedY
VLDWPYVEGLRMDEAMHPLSLLATGLYGKALPGAERRPAPPGGAVEVRLQVDQVDRPHPLHRPAAAHRVERVGAQRVRLLRQREPGGGPPRWSQARERRVGEFLRRPTLPFNGYAEQVAGLYRGMDLRRNF